MKQHTFYVKPAYRKDDAFIEKVNVDLRDIALLTARTRPYQSKHLGTIFWHAALMQDDVEEFWEEHKDKVGIAYLLVCAFVPQMLMSGIQFVAGDSTSLELKTKRRRKRTAATSPVDPVTSDNSTDPNDSVFDDASELSFDDSEISPDGDYDDDDDLDDSSLKARDRGDSLHSDPCPPDDLKIISQPPGFKWKDLPDRYYYKEPSGAGTVVYLINTDAELQHPVGLTVSFYVSLNSDRFHAVGLVLISHRSSAR